MPKGLVARSLFSSHFSCWGISSLFTANCSLITFRRRSALRIRIDFSDLGALDAYPSHQSLLVKNKCVNAFLKSGRGEILAKTGIKHHQARSCAKLNASAIVEIAQRIFVHEEKHVAKRLSAGLKTVGRSQGTIISHTLLVPAQSAVTILTGDDKAAFDNTWKN